MPSPPCCCVPTSPCAQFTCPPGQTPPPAAVFDLFLPPAFPFASCLRDVLVSLTPTGDGYTAEFDCAGYHVLVAIGCSGGPPGSGFGGWGFVVSVGFNVATAIYQWFYPGNVPVLSTLTSCNPPVMDWPVGSVTQSVSGTVVAPAPLVSARLRPAP